MQGKVHWFNQKKGYGFITDADGKDVFVHYTSIVGEGFKTLKEGEEVVYDLGSNDKGPMAINVVKVGAYE